MLGALVDSIALSDIATADDGGIVTVHGDGPLEVAWNIKARVRRTGECQQ